MSDIILEFVWAIGLIFIVALSANALIEINWLKDRSKDNE